MIVLTFRKDYMCFVCYKRPNSYSKSEKVTFRHTNFIEVLCALLLVRKNPRLQKRYAFHFDRCVRANEYDGSLAFRGRRYGNGLKFKAGCVLLSEWLPSQKVSCFNVVNKQNTPCRVFFIHLENTKRIKIKLLFQK